MIYISIRLYCMSIYGLVVRLSLCAMGTTPTPCEAQPRARPRARLFLSLKTLNIVGPSITPSTPQADVNELHLYPIYTHHITIYMVYMVPSSPPWYGPPGPGPGTLGPSMRLCKTTSHPSSFSIHT